MSAVAGFAASAAAQEKFQRLIVFGDSYSDLTLSDAPAANPLSSNPPGTSFPVWRVYPAPLKGYLGIPEVQDVAVGGATADGALGGAAFSFLLAPTMAAPGNLPQQVDAYLAANPSFGPRDLVTVSIGGNDGHAFLNTHGNDATAAANFGTATANLAAIEIGRLADHGARTFVLAGFSDMSLLVTPAEVNNPDAAKAFGAAYLNALQANLMPSAQSGVRYFILDLAKLGAQALADPRYGLEITGYVNGKPVSQCPGGTLGLICGATIDDPLGKKYLIGPDGFHPTTGGFDLVAKYMANIVMAPDTIAVQPGLVTTVTGGFAQSLLGRLDATRDARLLAGGGAGAAADGPMGLGAKEGSRTPQSGSAGPFTAYAMGTFLGGSRSDTPDLPGYDYDARSGTAGLELSVNRNLILGIAVNATTANAGLSNNANVDIDAIQAAVYASYATKQLFADVLAALGSHDVSLFRPGASPELDPVRSSTDATAFALAARGGYLFDLGSVRAGPIAGLTYVHARVGGYAETGDPLLTFNVSAQELDSLTGNVGVRFLAPFRAGGGTWSRT